MEYYFYLTSSEFEQIEKEETLEKRLNVLVGETWTRAALLQRQITGAFLFEVFGGNGATIGFVVRCGCISDTAEFILSATDFQYSKGTFSDIEIKRQSYIKSLSSDRNR